MLPNKVILYDDSCPLCRLYTWWFVAAGFLEPHGRMGFSRAPQSITDCLDLDRARHEIPLFDLETRHTLYGLEALTTVVASRWRWLAPVISKRWFRALLYPLYQIITFNRRVIAGCSTCGGFDCAPDLNRFFRSLYFVLASTIVAIVWGALVSADEIFSRVAASGLVALSALIFVTGFLQRLLTGSLVAWNHLGNGITLILMVAICLLPLVFVPQVPESMRIAMMIFAALVGVYELRRRGLNPA